MTELHPFQRAGLGFAPFKLAAVRRRAGGCCAYCGAIISNLFIVRDVDGKEFPVGCDCVAKVAMDGRCDPQMVRDAKRLSSQAKRDEERARFTAAYQALHSNETLFADRPHPFKPGHTYRDEMLYRLSGCRSRDVWRKAMVEVERELRHTA